MLPAYFKKIDWFLLLAVFILIGCGLLILYSIDQDFFQRQLIWVFLFSLTTVIGPAFDWRWLINQGWFRQILYWFNLFLLVFVKFQGEAIRGVKSWIVLGGFQFEPAEPMKVAVILVLAGFFSRRYLAAWLGKNIFISFLYVLLPMILIVIQPDFGSAIVIFSLWLGFLLMSGINKKRLLIGFILAVVAVIIGWNYFLHPYQQGRLIGFIFPNLDPLGINYNVIQSKISIGSAGFWGKGFEAGAQSRLDFLPEAHTDFIFAAFTEEWGIAGAAFLIMAFILVIYRLAQIGIQARDNYSKFIVLGTIFILLIHFSLNLGANLGLLPVTGITLPFVSYGGSNLLTLGILLAIIQRIKIESR